jgi:hypothetical protein
VRASFPSAGRSITTFIKSPLDRPIRNPVNVNRPIEICHVSATYQLCHVKQNARTNHRMTQGIWCHVDQSGAYMCHFWHMSRWVGFKKYIPVSGWHVAYIRRESDIATCEWNFRNFDPESMWAIRSGTVRSTSDFATCISSDFVCWLKLMLIHIIFLRLSPTALPNFRASQF